MCKTELQDNLFLCKAELKDYLGVRYLQVYGKELNRRGKVNLVVI